MKRLLLDTHAFLWWLSNNPKLGKKAREAIADETSLVHVSAATIWEIAIKAQLGKIDPGTDRIDQEIPANDFVELPISAQHALRAGNLLPHHNDPFDRMLIAQAQIEDLIVVTHDTVFRSYEIKILST
ncbi:MAG TPA: type II toxin-antitoxin system VapC family toxin [Candidatus Binatia bacterium]|nr:type II toxin-antitoxin system VapC family toxin [Candidatus Binatia bacterium]